MSEQNNFFSHNFKPGDVVTVLEYWVDGYENDPHYGKGASIDAYMGINVDYLEFRFQLTDLTVVVDESLSTTLIDREGRWWYNGIIDDYTRPYEDIFTTTPVQVLRTGDYDARRYKARHAELLTSSLDLLTHKLKDSKAGDAIISGPGDKSRKLEELIRDIKNDFHDTHPRKEIGLWEIQMSSLGHGRPAATMRGHCVQDPAQGDNLSLRDFPAKMRYWISGTRSEGRDVKITRVKE